MGLGMHHGHVKFDPEGGVGRCVRGTTWSAQLHCRGLLHDGEDGGQGIPIPNVFLSRAPKSNQVHRAGIFLPYAQMV